ncbi:MAG: hypothetical protein ACR2QK_22350 [Acidimicrobiales bacterium]
MGVGGPLCERRAAMAMLMGAAILVGACSGGSDSVASVDVESYRWQQTADDSPWGGRAGLRVVEMGGDLYLLGGRTPRQSTVPGDSEIWADVWQSDDLGDTWSAVPAGGEAAPWPARAYFQAVVKGDTMFVLGGQDFGLEPNPFCALLEKGLKPPPGLGIDPDAPCPEFLPTSQFFNDVWSSTDGQTWNQQTDSAPWVGRAGLSAVVLGDHIYVLGGSRNDDASIIGANGPTREYFNDVWRSTDGAEWELMIEEAPWERRAGASVVAHRGAIWLFGGEAGFLCEPTPDCEPPYFNDVWRTTDGTEWEEVSEAAGWSPRPGHQCEVLGDDFVCFGGFGIVGNPDDVWFSGDGVEWTELDGPPWNAPTSDEIRYDFDSLSVDGPDGPMILTFGGDRETFDFEDPENYLRIEDDVWSFAGP